MNNKLPSVKGSMTTVDKALVGVAGFAAKSGKLTPVEKRELRALATKGLKKGKQGFNAADRARCIWLIRKAGPESIPTAKLPKRLKRVLGFENATEIPPVREPPPSVDPLDRLEKLAALRGAPLSEAQFAMQVDRTLADPAIAGYVAGEGADPLDRLARVGALEATSVLTTEQAAALTQQILDAS